ncbi:MAG TPA: S41 family peptidase [Anaerolineales bacterium]|nr:S41 family peptidase [Anaerolineales bacterium]
MNTKREYRVILVIVAIVLLAGTCSAGFIIGRVTTRATSATNANSPVDEANVDELFIPFWEAWQIVNDQYLEQPVDQERMMQGAINGMLESLGDQHTSYMDPTQYGDATATLEGYDGIGAYVNTDGEILTIIEPIKGSPAEAADLRPGDEILAINGEDMTNILPEVARLKVLGPAGTTVILTIRREGIAEPFDVEITRAHIVIPSVEYEILDGQIAYIRLLTFGETSADDIHAALEELLAQNPRGLIFDLRNNSGGYLQSAVDISSEFIAEGPVAYEEYGEGTRITYDATGDGIATEIPMLVLVNEWSASASELVAGALQDVGRAELVGTITYGKGTVQTWIPLSNDQGAVRVTIARWLTPNGTNVHEIGLTPDYEVAYTEEDMLAGLDPQLDRAVEILTQR